MQRGRQVLVPSLVESICARCARNVTEAWCELSGGNGCVLFRGPEHQRKINREGIWLEALDRNPERHLLEADSDDSCCAHRSESSHAGNPCGVDEAPVKTRVLLTGTMVVAGILPTQNSRRSWMQPFLNTLKIIRCIMLGPPKARWST